MKLDSVVSVFPLSPKPLTLGMSRSRAETSLTSDRTQSPDLPIYSPTCYNCTVGASTIHIKVASPTMKICERNTMPQLQGQRHRPRSWYWVKGLITRKTHMKNENPSTYCSKVMAKVKVDNKQTGEKLYTPDLSMRGHKKDNFCLIPCSNLFQRTGMEPIYCQVNYNKFY